MFLRGRQEERGQLRNSSQVYVSVEVKVKAQLMLSPSHEESCHVTLLICSHLLWDTLSSVHMSRMSVLTCVQRVLLLLSSLGSMTLFLCQCQIFLKPLARCKI